MDLGALIGSRHVLVTGASGGLGEHFARLCARNGAAVTVAARRLDRLEQLVPDLVGLGARHARAVSLDVTNEASVRAALAASEADGAPALDVLVNNAGIARTAQALDASTDDFDAVLATNLRGPWLLSTEAARRWKAASRPGTIVNVASILGMRVMAGVASYAASKAALVHMTKALALEWARWDIRVNALCPGYVATEINAGFFDTVPGRRVIDRIPMRRIGQPSDLDGAFLLLATEASAWMTGSALAIDGGHVVSGL